jgi:hypothetical protein
LITLVLSLLLTAPDYVVLSGETCRSVSRKLGLSLDELHAANPQLGPISPHNLTPGQVLKTAVAAAPKTLADAQLTYIKPDVDRRPATEKKWSPAAVHEALFRMDEVSTRKGAGAELTFQDESKLPAGERRHRRARWPGCCGQTAQGQRG